MDVLPVAGQLALKRLSDPAGYDRVAVNRLRGRADEAITEAEVDEWVKRIWEVDNGCQVDVSKGYAGGAGNRTPIV
jgi:hypothetical protein